MERFLKDFDLPSKEHSDEDLREWRQAVGIVKNHRRRFRYAADLEKRSEAEELKDRLKEKIRISLIAHKAALHFIDAGSSVKRVKEAEQSEPLKLVDDDLYGKQTSFSISPDVLESVSKKDICVLKKHGGVLGIARSLAVAPEEGISSFHRPSIAEREYYFGRNQFTDNIYKSFWMFVWESLHDITLIILMACSVVSICVGVTVEGWPKGTYEGLGIIFSVYLVVIVTASSDYKQYVLFQDLTKEKNKFSVKVIRDKRKKAVPISNLVVGDIVQLYIGDRIPADGLFVRGNNLLIDESSITGESEPLHVSRNRPYLLSGSGVHDGSGEMLVTSVGLRTEFGKVVALFSQSGEDETPLQVKLNGIATFVAKMGAVFSLFVFLALVVRFSIEKVLHHEFLMWTSKDALKLLNCAAVAVTIFMGAVPEGLPLAVVLSLAFAMRRLLNESALVRHPSACEAMGSVTCICTDKTGTLTTIDMVVDRVQICNEVIRGKDANLLKSVISESLFYALLQSFCLNTSAEEVEGEDGKRKIWGSPTESALLQFGLLLGAGCNSEFWRAEHERFEPFSSWRKRMSTIISLPHGGRRALTKGAPDVILKMCDKIIDGNGLPAYFSGGNKKDVMDVIDKFSSEALRILCFAYRDIAGTLSSDEVPDEGYTLLAIVGINNPVRPGVKNAVQECLASGISVKMVTGDNINTAKAVAKECGILTDDGLIIKAPDFRDKSLEEQMKLVPKIQVLALSTPGDKLMLVNLLKKASGEVVAVTGDGSNDIPALREADIGLAMGIAGTQVAKENADVVIMDDNFATVISLIKWGRAVYVHMQNFLQFQLTVNSVAIALNICSACLTGSAPLSPVQLIWINMIMDILGALALATEPASDKFMRRPPVTKHTSFITPSMWRNIIGQSIYQLIILLIFKFKGKWLLKLERSDSGSIIDTFIFNSFVFCQVFNEINSREADQLNVFSGIWKSWLFISIIVFIVAFQVVIVQYLGLFASTVPLSWQLWLVSVLIGFSCLILAIVLKCVKPALRPQTVEYGYVSLPSCPDLA